MYIKGVELKAQFSLCILRLQAVKFSESLCNYGTHLYSIQYMPQLPKQSYLHLQIIRLHVDTSISFCIARINTVEPFFFRVYLNGQIREIKILNIKSC